MDNRRWYNRFATIFWWGLTILPLIVALIKFTGYHLTFNSGISSATDLSAYHGFAQGDFWYIFNNVIGLDSSSLFGNVTLPFIIDMFENLFDLLGFTDEYYSYSMFLSYMVTVQFYHLIFDFIVWLPQWFHRIMEKGMDKLS